MIRRILLLTGPSPVPSSKVKIRRTQVLADCQAQNSEGEGHTFQCVGYRRLPSQYPCAHLLDAVKALQRAAALDNALTIVAA